MFDSVGLTTAAAAFFVVAASPGPATIAVAGVSMRSGRQTGLRFGYGLSVGLAFWGLVGLEFVCPMITDARDPSRNLPRAMKKGGRSPLFPCVTAGGQLGISPWMPST